ncbi:hypothetical protein NFI96_025853, partial [Prochilodus magdalenae]
VNSQTNCLRIEISRGAPQPIRSVQIQACGDYTQFERLQKERKTKEKTCCPGSAEGTSKVPNAEAPATKRRKETVTQPRRKTRGQKKATEPENERKRGEEECCLSAEEGTSKVPTNDAPAAKKRTNNNGPKSPKTAKRQKKKITARRKPPSQMTSPPLGYVFEGRRISDGLQVAIKFVAKRPSDEYLRSPIESKVVPIEVTLMQMMSQPPVCKNTVRLIEWPDKYILVLERPDP